MEIFPPDAALHLAALVASSDDAIASKDLDGIITSWNAGAERLFGYTAAEVIGRSITIIIPPDRLAEEDMVLGNIRRGESVAHFDTIRRRKDGSLVEVSLTVSPIRDADGRVIGASKIARDISDRSRMERELREVQRRLMALAAAAGSIASSPDTSTVLSALIELARDVFASDGYAFWRLDQDGVWRVVRSLGISEAFAARGVPTRAGAGGQPIEALSGPLICTDLRTQSPTAALREAYMQEGLASMIVFPLRIQGVLSGTMAFYSREPRTYANVDIQMGGALANLAAAALTTIELSQEQRRAREAADQASRQSAFLAEAGAVLGASLEYETTLKAVARLAVPVIADWCAVDILDDRGELQRLAVAHADPAKVDLAHTLQERYPESPDSPSGVHHVIRTGQAAYMWHIPPEAIDAYAKDDEHRALLRSLNLQSYMCVPLVAQGKPFGAMTFICGDSGRAFSDADLRFAQELAARASLAVENARAYAQARAASRLKDEFLATLSHELRTPLNAVLGYARMLRFRTLPPANTQGAVEVIERNATALKRIIEDVLDVSQIISGRLRLRIEPVDLPSILQEAAATVVPAADAKGVRLETIIDPVAAPVSGDPDRLQQIVWNLLSNAVKFTPRGGRVQLQLARTGSQVEIVVSDTGRGIAPDFLPFVFDRFRQADATFAREHGGLGLGLAIAKQLTELHGGTIRAASGGPDQGAVFTVALPLMIMQPAAPQGREQPQRERQMPQLAEVPRLDGTHVLAVDDERDSLALLRAVLQGAGATVSVAHSGAEALAVLEQADCDVLIADIGMPGMDGLQLIRAVRDHREPVRSIPAAALTAYARAQDRITSLASGFQMHLVKPIDPLELILAVATLQRQHRAS